MRLPGRSTRLCRLPVWHNLHRLINFTDDDFLMSVHNKLMGQVNFVRIGCPYLSNGGSFTVTSGVLGREPMKGSAAISFVNAGLDGFVRATALELPRRLPRERRQPSVG